MQSDDVRFSLRNQIINLQSYFSLKKADAFLSLQGMYSSSVMPMPLYHSPITGYHPYYSPAQQPNLPLQRDNHDRMESPKPEQTIISSTTPPKQAASDSSADTMPGGASDSTTKYAVVQVPPRMPGIPVDPSRFFGYPPYMMQPGLQDDPRSLPMGLQPQPPYCCTFPHHMSRGAYPSVVPQPVHVQIPTQNVFYLYLRLILLRLLLLFPCFLK